MKRFLSGKLLMMYLCIFIISFFIGLDVAILTSKEDAGTMQSPPVMEKMPAPAENGTLQEEEGTCLNDGVN